VWTSEVRPILSSRRERTQSIRMLCGPQISNLPIYPLLSPFTSSGSWTGLLSHWHHQKAGFTSWSKLVSKRGRDYNSIKVSAHACLLAPCPTLLPSQIFHSVISTAASSSIYKSHQVNIQITWASTITVLFFLVQICLLRLLRLEWITMWSSSWLIFKVEGLNKGRTPNTV